MVLVLFGALVFFFPVAAYFLFLAWVNSREHPTLITGPWDFVGVLLATSGFLVAGGPSILGAFYSAWRLPLSQGQLPAFSRTSTGTWTVWLVAWGIYFALILGGATYFLRRRRSVTAIYNVDIGTFDEVLGLALTHLQLHWRRVGNRIFIGPSEGKFDPDPVKSSAIQTSPGGSEEVAAEGDPAPLPRELSGRSAGLELEPFPAACHVTLHWQGDDASVRQDVEAELGRRLLEVAAPENAAASWFLTISSCLFGVLLLALVGFILFKMRSR